MALTPSASSASKSPMYNRTAAHSKRYWDPVTAGGTVLICSVFYCREVSLVSLSVSALLGISIKHEAYICQEFIRVCFSPAVHLPLFPRPHM
jgi:hypothetical protein